MRNINIVGMGLGMMVLAFCMTSSANAFDVHHDHHHHDHVGVGLGFGFSSSPTYVSGGHYEYQTQTVMVVPAATEQRFIPAVYRTEVLSTGVTVQVLVSNGYWETFTVPAQYETRSVQVWVPDTCYYSSSPRVSVGLGFRF